MRLEDGGGFSFEAMGDESVEKDFLLIVEFSKVQSAVSVGKSR